MQPRCSRETAERQPRGSRDPAETQPRPSRETAERQPRDSRGSGRGERPAGRAATARPPVSGTPHGPLLLPRAQELTKVEGVPLGGTAFLSLEDPSEPYLHGIKFTAMPPAKRFRDMEQLSGGERSRSCEQRLFTPAAVNRSNSPAASARWRRWRCCLRCTTTARRPSS